MTRFFVVSQGSGNFVAGRGMTLAGLPGGT